MSPGPLSQTTTLQALMSLLKGYCGTGILSMPHAFSDSGYAIGVFGTMLIGFLCNNCIHMLVEINDLHKTKPEQLPYDYEELAEISFEYGPKKLRKHSKLSRKILSICLCTTQIGFCTAYALFIAKNLLQFCINMKIGNWHEDDVAYFLFFLLLIMVPMNFIKSIRHLAIGSTFANVIQLTSLSIIIYNLVTNIPNVGDRKPVNDKVPQFVSTTVFTFEGITVTMPLYRSMKQREKFAKPLGVLNMAILIVIILYCSIGALGYLKYGEDVAASITLSLPSEPLYSSVQLMYALAIMFSYPLQMFVCIQLTWPVVRDWLTYQKRSELVINTADYLLRTTLVLITFILAVSVPELDLVIELIGAFSCSAVAIIIPSILHLVTFMERKQGFAKTWLYVKDLTILGFGLIAFCTGTYFSLQGIIDRLAEKALHIDVVPGEAIHKVLSSTTSSNHFLNFTNLNDSNTKMPVWFEKLVNISLSGAFGGPMGMNLTTTTTTSATTIF